ncbi:hypothetical protein SUDANB95_03078 [Actinosynnema sp. ALI-1.44]
MTTPRPWYRKRRVLGLLILLCVYVMLFLYDGVRWGDKPETAADAVGRNVRCEASGFHLGLVHDCSVSFEWEGKTYTDSFRHEISPADIGREVPITMTSKAPRTGYPRFIVARAYDGPPELLMPLSWFLLGITALVLMFRIFSVTNSLNRAREGASDN